MSLRAMTVAGIMSGTSADGIDVALVRIVPAKSRPKVRLLAHEGFAFPAVLRRAILAAMNADSISTAELARLNWRLGIAYAEAVKAALNRHKVKLDLIGCHGQTLYHQARAEMYAGRRFACTWQAGEAAVIAQSLGLPVASNFRPADMTAGGEGAPLVPLLDYVLFADAKRGRVLQNIGGIANLTAIPAGAVASGVIAFDTGPGNMVIDALAQELFGKTFDRNGAFAARGTVLERVLAAELHAGYFRREPPKTAGREQFGRTYVADFLAQCRRYSKNPEDALATATALTAEAIAQGYERFAQPRMLSGVRARIFSGAKAHSFKGGAMYGLKPVPFVKPIPSTEPVPLMKPVPFRGNRWSLNLDSESVNAVDRVERNVDYIVSGGGARNATLMAMLKARLEPMGCELSTSEDFGLPAEAKEAAAFALLAWQTWHRLPGNVPAATGAARPVVLGQVTYA